MIFAMQRPDGEYIKTALRDNFMKRLTVGHLESTGYDMMFGDANKNKEFKKLDKVNGKKVKGRGYIANNGELAGEFFAPYVPFDKGFSFYDEFIKLPVLEEDSPTMTQEPIMEELPIEEPTEKETEELLEVIRQKRSLADFAKEKDLNIKTLRKILYLLDERGIPLEKEDNSLMVTPFVETLLLETLGHFEDGGGRSYPKAVEACLAHHGLGQEQGPA